MEPILKCADTDIHRPKHVRHRYIKSELAESQLLLCVSRLTFLPCFTAISTLLAPSTLSFDNYTRNVYLLSQKSIFFLHTIFSVQAGGE